VKIIPEPGATLKRCSS